MIREIVRPLAALKSAGALVTLLPGTLIHDCRILSTKDEPYVVEFEAAGCRYTCPLYSFQPRTHALAPETVEPAVLLRSASSR